MPTLYKPVSPDTVEDFFRFFDHIAFRDHPEWGCGCYCCCFHETDKAVWESKTPQANAADVRALILSGNMRGMLAYQDGQPVGWCHFDRLENLPGIALVLPTYASPSPKDGAVVCFTVAQGYRGQGVASGLLSAALAEFKAMGVTRVEAYPLMEGDNQEHHYHGPLSLYLKQGFTFVREQDGRAVVEKQL